MDLQLPPDFKEFLALLNSAEIEYLLVGGYAVSFHGYPRPTGDLDIWIAIHPDNASKLVAALERFGFTAGVSQKMFLTPGHVVRMGVPPVRIELLSSISGVDFSDCYHRRMESVIDGTPVCVIGRDDLLANKRAAGRDKDLNDLSQLERGSS